MYLHHEKPARVASGNAAAVGSLLADMNHDIRTSMNGVIGMLELLLDTGLSPAQQQYARTAQHSVDALLEVLERIVDLSLIEANQLRLTDAPFDLLHEMQAVCTGKKEAARAKGTKLSLTHPPAVLLRGDAARLRTAVSGLIDLAMRFAGDDGVAVHMDAQHESPGHCNLNVSVAFSGLYDEADRLAAMLNQPVDSDPGLFRLQGRSTLELGLCARLARLMGGRLSVERGASRTTVLRFCASLPLAAPTLGGKRGLIIATSAQEWKTLLSPLAHQGVRLDACDSATDGLAVIAHAVSRHAPYHLILLGRQVQGMDADVLAAAIKGDPTCGGAVLALLDDTCQGATCLTGSQFAARIEKSASPAMMMSTLGSLVGMLGGSTPVQPPSSASTPAHLGDGIYPDFRGCRILVADDNAVNQQVAAHMLEKLGCHCELASDGAQAVNLHAANRYDLILMDCDMPGVDGFQATQRIRAAEQPGRRTPIIALTACTGQGEREQCLASGMDDFLSKPIRPQMLKEMLARWLAPAPAAAENTAETNIGDELEAVHEMFGDDFPELAALYQNDGAPRLRALREAHACGDLARIAKVAHALGGSSASIGATGLAELCKELETSAKSGLLQDFEQRLATIQAEYGRICNKLQSMLPT